MRSRSNDSARPDDTDPSNTQHDRSPQGFGHRHGLKVMTGVMALMFALVVFVEVAC